MYLTDSKDKLTVKKNERKRKNVQLKKIEKMCNFKTDEENKEITGRSEKKCGTIFWNVNFSKNLLRIKYEISLVDDIVLYQNAK